MWYPKWKVFNFVGGVLLVTLLTGCQSNSSSETSSKYKVKTLPETEVAKSNPIEKTIKQQYDSWKGTPYRYGGDTKRGVDCSALVANYYDNFFDLSLPRVTSSQAQVGSKVSKPQPGDLVFFKTGRGSTGLHVGIYYKDGKFLHVGSSSGVAISDMNNSYWKKRYWQSRRVVE